MKGDRKKGLTLIAGVIFAVNTSGCATLVNGRNQEIAVSSTPSGATVKTGDVQTTTPGKLTLRRNEDHELTFTKDDFPERQIKLESTGSWWLLGNVVWGLFGGVIGVAIDTANGAGSKLKPGSVDINMETGLIKEVVEQPAEPAKDAAGTGTRP